MDTPPIITQPPTIPPGKKPFAFQAAQTSLLAPLASIGVGFIVNVGMGNQTTPLARLITGYLCVLLIVLGFLFGIIALLGARGKTRKEFLWRAVCGIALNGVFLAFFAFAWFTAQQRR